MNGEAPAFTHYCEEEICMECRPPKWIAQLQRKAAKLDFVESMSNSWDLRKYFGQKRLGIGDMTLVDTHLNSIKWACSSLSEEKRQEVNTTLNKLRSFLDDLGT